MLNSRENKYQTKIVFLNKKKIVLRLQIKLRVKNCVIKKYIIKLLPLFVYQTVIVKYKWSHNYDLILLGSLNRHICGLRAHHTPVVQVPQEQVSPIIDDSGGRVVRGDEAPQASDQERDIEKTSECVGFMFVIEIRPQADAHHISVKKARHAELPVAEGARIVEDPST